MEEFADDPTKLVGDVDCTADGEPLCATFGIEGFPTLKWGDPSNLEDYDGGRDYEELKAFAEENLKPLCSVINIDLCDDEQKALIEKFQALDIEKLSELVEGEEEKLEQNEENLMKEIEALQEKYEALTSEKEEKDKVIRDAGLSFMKSVLAFKEKEAPSSEGSDEL